MHDNGDSSPHLTSPRRDKTDPMQAVRGERDLKAGFQLGSAVRDALAAKPLSFSVPLPAETKQTTTQAVHGERELKAGLPARQRCLGLSFIETALFFSPSPRDGCSHDLQHDAGRG